MGRLFSRGASRQGDCDHRERSRYSGEIERRADADPRHEHRGEEWTGDGAEIVTGSLEPECTTVGARRSNRCEDAVRAGDRTLGENQASARRTPTCHTATLSPINPVATACQVASTREPAASMWLIGQRAGAELCESHQPVAKSLDEPELRPAEA